jgi:hypothetical protein
MRHDQQNARGIFFRDGFAIHSSDDDGRACRNDARDKHRLRTSEESNRTKPAHTGPIEPAEPGANDTRCTGREQR